MNREEFDEYINEVYWKFAKTYADTFPHEYTIREWRKDLDDKFEEAARFIRRNGEAERFFSKIHIYYYHKGHKYWTMGAPFNETIVINREVLKDDTLEGKE